MLQAACRHGVSLERVSFAGSLAAARRFSEALLQTNSGRQHSHLIEQMLLALAADLVPHRPGRREPRAVKRRAKPYPLLMGHRHRWLGVRKSLTGIAITSKRVAGLEPNSRKD